MARNDRRTRGGPVAKQQEEVGIISGHGSTPMNRIMRAEKGGERATWLELAKHGNHKWVDAMSRRSFTSRQPLNP